MCIYVSVIDKLMLNLYANAKGLEIPKAMLKKMSEVGELIVADIRLLIKSQ